MLDDAVQIRFESPDELRREFEKNIANRGIFVATEREFEVRSTIDVDIYLDYVNASEIALSLRGEVVHCIPPEMAASGATPGVAVQFEETASELREVFTPLLETSSSLSTESPSESPAESTSNSESTSESTPEAEPQESKDSEGIDRRGAKRGSVRVPVRIMPRMSPPFEATSRDLSATGILLSMRSDVLPIGEIVRTCLWHPSGEPSIEIDGQVVREVKNKSGRIAAVAVAFDRNQAADPRISEVIDALRHAGHRSRLGGISGSIVDLGLANMLQMFGSSAPEGTLVVDRDGEQGWVAFAGGELLGAELGGLTDHDALVAMIDWGDGRFQFEATADSKLVENAPRRPLEGAVFEAVCELDERARFAATEDDEHDPNGETMLFMSEATTFMVDLDQVEISSSSLDKTAEAVLELAKSGMSTERLKLIIPESPEAIQLAIDEWVELGVLIPR